MSEPSPLVQRDLHVADGRGEAGVPDPLLGELRIGNLSAAIASGDLLASYALGVGAIRAALEGDKGEEVTHG